MSICITEPIQEDLDNNFNGRQIKNLREFPQHIHYKLAEGREDEISFIDLFNQINTPRKLDPVMGMLMAQILLLIKNHDLGIIAIPTKKEACRDHDKYGNQEALNTLPEPFKTMYTGGPGTKNDDGYLLWDTEHAKAPNNLMPKCFYDTSCSPLEVGSCPISTLYWHLIQNGSVCRFPYGKKFIYLIGVTDHVCATKTLNL